MLILIAYEFLVKGFRTGDRRGRDDGSGGEGASVRKVGSKGWMCELVGRKRGKQQEII